MKKKRSIKYLTQTIVDLREGLSERDEEISILRAELDRTRLELVMCQRDYIKLKKKAGILIPIDERRKELFTK